MLVAGRGPAGSVAALTLARRGLDVILAAPEQTPARRIGETLPGGARPLLRDLGLMDLLTAGGHLSSPGNRFAWAELQPEHTDAIRHPHGAGWHLDRARFDRDIRASAASTGARIATASVESVAPVANDWSVRLRAPGSIEAVRARAVIDATGRRARLARSLGARRSRDDDLVALYAYYAGGEGSPDRRTLIEATADGWWYNGALPDGPRVVALQTAAATAARIRAGREGWMRRLAATCYIAAAVEGQRQDGALRGCEACGAQTLPAIGRRWIAVGDAALSFDPLSSQGLLTALYTGWKGAEATAAALAGDMGPLEEYARRLDAIRSRYLQQRALAYAEVTRYATHPFWSTRRRHPAYPTAAE